MSAVSRFIYDIPTFLFAEALISVVRGKPDHAKQLISKSNNNVTIDPSELENIATLCMKTPKSLEEANQLASSLIEPLNEGSIPLPTANETQILVDRIAIRYLATNPETLSDKRILEPVGLKSHNGYLNEDSFTEEGWRKQFKLARLDLEEVEKIPKDSLSNSDLEVLEIIKFVAETKLLYEKNDAFFCEFPANQLTGIPFMITMIFTEVMSLDNDEDCKLYNLRLQKAATKIENLANYVVKQHQMGFAMPGFICDKVSEMLDGGFCSKSGKETPFGSRLAGNHENISKDLLDEGIQIVDNQIIPAYKKLKDAVVNSRPDKSLDDNPAGLSRLNSGNDYYVAELRYQTTTSFTPKEIYNLGLQRVKMIQNEMKKILVEKLNQPDDVDPIEFMRKVNSDKENRNFFYGEDVGQISAIQKYEMRTLTAHEGVPGHHFQLALAAETNDPSRILQKIEFFSLNAFWEGWALHAEALAGECGYYDNDPYDWLGHYGDALFRAARLVVDSALHSNTCLPSGKAFTKQEAVKYFVDNTTLDISDIESEVNRYIIFPGQACGYMLGKICIEEEREKWRAAGGDDVSFHDFILSTCGLPLDALRKSVAKKIQKE